MGQQEVLWSSPFIVVAHTNKHNVRPLGDCNLPAIIVVAHLTLCTENICGDLMRFYQCRFCFGLILLWALVLTMRNNL